MTQTPPDMKNIVDSNRSLLKKIELAIPGFRGYRKKEDLRVADNLLRIYMADKLSRICSDVGEVKGVASKRLDLNLVSMIGEAENAVGVVEKRLRHSEQGYSGVAPDYRIAEEELNSLYSYDAGLLDNVYQIERGVASLQGKAVTWSPGEIEKDIVSILESVKTLSRLLDDRRKCLMEVEEVKP